MGGGSVANNTTNSLANPPLKWMINEILDPAKNLGIYFKPGAFSEIEAFNTLVRTAVDPTPRIRRPMIPSKFLKRSQRDEGASEATAVSPAPRQPTGSAPLPTPPPTANTTSATPPFSSDIPESSSPTADGDDGGDDGAAANAMGGETVVSVQENAPPTDANALMYDQLAEHKWWWIIEYLPLPQRWQAPDGTWHKKWRYVN